jgi:hypothetical protein
MYEITAKHFRIVDIIPHNNLGFSNVSSQRVSKQLFPDIGAIQGSISAVQSQYKSS